VQSEIKANGKALSRTCRTRLEGLPDARRSWWGSRRQEEWKLSARSQLEGNDRALEANQIATLMYVSSFVKWLYDEPER
jgi:hypothetical protein